MKPNATVVFVFVCSNIR